MMEAGPAEIGANASARNPSLRSRLLKFLLIPTLALMLLDTGFVYLVALRYSNHVHDRDLAISTLGLATALRGDHSDGSLTHAVRLLLEYNPNGRSFFSVVSARHGLVSASTPRAPVAQSFRRDDVPEMFSATIQSLPVRAASVRIRSPVDAADTLVVSMAESMHGRQARAQEILLLTIPIQVLLFAVQLALVWQGVRFGLRILDLPIRRLAARERNLEPISGPDIPIEILPMTRTIDGLFARVQELVSMQERFVSDAAHQLRTPLAGLAMHSERALAAGSADDLRTAMLHVRVLTSRVARTAAQLLTLARLQSPAGSSSELNPVDLATWLPEAVALRVPESLQAGVDLGYEGTDRPALIAGEAHGLQEMLDNLIDNAIGHARKGGIVTVSLRVPVGVSSGVAIVVEDSGAGVDDVFLPQLGERFFRVHGAPDGGSGLGLAIVKRIADAHDAALAFGRSALGGLQVMVTFPLATSARPVAASPAG